MENSLHEDLMFSIFARLPVKSVVRFMCLNKTWNISMQGQSFVQLRKLHHNNINFVFVCPSNDLQALSVFLGHLPIPIHEDIQDHPLEDQVLSLPNPNLVSFTIQALNGLLCIQSHSFPLPPTIHVGNPTTQRIVTLPEDNTLELGPEVSIFTHFGYDPLHNTFKVLNFINDASLPVGSYELRILTIGEYAWKVIFPDDFTLNLHCLESKGLCVNGAMHWVDFDNEILIAFDVGQEQFRKIPITGGQDSEEEVMISHELLELGGNLSLVKFMKDGYIKLSILKDYKNQVWVQEMIELPDAPPIDVLHPPVCKLYTEETLLLLYRVDEDVTRAYYYDVKTSRHVSFHTDLRLGEFQLFPYQENFMRL